MNKFSEWLVKWRAESGLSLRQLESATNKVCTFGYINQLEKGTAGKKKQGWQPDIEIVEALAVALERPIDEAREAAGYAPQKGTARYDSLVSTLFEGFKERVEASGVDNIEDEIEQKRIFNDLTRIAEMMVEDQIKAQESKKKIKLLKK